jgi:hypothetical protein
LIVPALIIGEDTASPLFELELCRTSSKPGLKSLKKMVCNKPENLYSPGNRQLQMKDEQGSMHSFSNYRYSAIVRIGKY